MLTPQPVEASMCTRVYKSELCVSKQDPYPGPGPLYIICRNTLYFVFESFDIATTHSKACRNKTCALCKTSNGE